MTSRQLLLTRAVTVPAPRSATAVTRCRSCGTAGPTEFLSLGSTPLANALVEPATAGATDPAYPLAVGFCSTCALVQLTHELPAEAIFGSEYAYFSSFSETLLRHSADHVDALVAQRGLGAGSFVVEIASNDGYLLRRFVEHGVPVLGVEPSAKPAEAARRIGVPTLGAYFGAALAETLLAEHGPADVVLAKNVLAHVPDLNDVVAGLAVLVADDGIVQVENPGVADLIDGVAFDTIYHEHFCYFSTTAIARLFARHGLRLIDVEHFPDLHGGTLRWTAARRGTPSGAVGRMLAQDTVRGLDRLEFYADFGQRVARNQHELVALVRALRAEGATIAAYGAAAKGATLLNSSGLGADEIDFVVDLNVHKQGMLMSGARLPVLDPAALLERRPDYVLLLAWNFREEIVRQQAAYGAAGGRWIVPVPRPRIV